MKIWKQFSVFAFVLLFTSGQVLAAPHSGIKEAFDEFTYTLEVQGALQSAEGRKAATEKLKQDLKALNLSHDELINAALAEVKDQALAAELRKVFSQINAENMSPEEVQMHIQRLMQLSASRGASWNGTVATVVFVVAMVIIAVVMATQGPGACSDPAYFEANESSCDRDYIDWDWDP